MIGLGEFSAVNYFFRNRPAVRYEKKYKYILIENDKKNTERRI